VQAPTVTVTIAPLAAAVPLKTADFPAVLR
jgi:hypothetical protein